VGMCIGFADDKVIAVTSKGNVKVLKWDEVGRRGRAARGSSVVRLKDNETVARLAPMVKQIELPEAEAAPEKKPKVKRAGKAAEAKVKAARPAPKAKAKPASKKAPASRPAERPSQKK